MKVGFDAKRFFHNNTGLGNYSRTLVEGLATYFPQHEYYLFNPKTSRHFQKTPLNNVFEIKPAGFLSKTFSSAWRSIWVKNDIKKLGIDIYHGLSHEIPVGIQNTNVPSVVTIHDLIFERYPEQFGKINVGIYRKKFRYACTHADRIIAISEQTKRDIIDIYGISASKIDVCYQSCDPAFLRMILPMEKLAVQQKYQLPQKFFLYVGSIIERKNLLGICRAMKINTGVTDLPLVVIGKGGAYKKEVQSYIKEQNLSHRIIFLSETFGNIPGQDLPAIYQMAEAMIYPSFFEGFGIPVLEALSARVPVITSTVSCLPETGGDAAFYVDPSKPEEIAASMIRVLSDKQEVEINRDKGTKHAAKFSVRECSASVMRVYKKVLNDDSI